MKLPELGNLWKANDQITLVLEGRVAQPRTRWGADPVEGGRMVRIQDDAVRLGLQSLGLQAYRIHYR